MNEIKTGCGGCYYCLNGQCTYEKKCSGSYSYTINNIDDKIICTPHPPIDPNTVYVNSPIVISQPNKGIGINKNPPSLYTYSDIHWHYADKELPKKYKEVLYKTLSNEYFVGIYYDNIFCGEEESSTPDCVDKWAYVEPYEEEDR